MSPPHGCTLPQLPLLLLHADRIGAKVIAIRIDTGPPKRIFMPASVSPEALTGK